MIIQREHLPSTARMVAHEAHQGQRYFDGRHFIEHPRDVATLVASQYYGQVAEATAWLHDTIEKGGLTEDDIAELGFPSVVIESVVNLTFTSKESEGMSKVAKSKLNPISHVVRHRDLTANIYATLNGHANMEPDEYARRLSKYYADLKKLKPPLPTHLEVNEYVKFH